ncbi:unnamed protein product [Gordionus sp. m RMFG-2023]|uniref:U11/U12 small nuclear ribonucleoprotein 25 kDa protein-like n=1 Tax=Gordionus sp. m RMFG-2023 TaxID=3053472 RepID=UPI0030E3F876
MSDEHKLYIKKINSKISKLSKKDLLLKDIYPKISIDELNALIAKEKGEFYNIILKKMDDEEISIHVPHHCTVNSLKNLIKKRINRKLMVDSNRQNICWKYIWKTYWLYYKGQKLSDEKNEIEVYGIHENSKITFIKRLRKK